MLATSSEAGFLERDGQIKARLSSSCSSLSLESFKKPKPNIAHQQIATSLDSSTLSIKQLFKGKSQTVAACGPVHQRQITRSQLGNIDTGEDNGGQAYGTSTCAQPVNPCRMRQGHVDDSFRSYHGKHSLIITYRFKQRFKQLLLMKMG